MLHVEFDLRNPELASDLKPDLHSKNASVSPLYNS